MMGTKQEMGPGGPVSRPDYIVVGKERTELHIPSCHQALDDSLEDWTNLSAQSRHLDAMPDSKTRPQTLKLQEAPSRLPSCKRKLALVCESLSGRDTPKGNTPKFKSLQALWENKSGSASDVELESSQTVAEEILQSAPEGVKVLNSVQTTVGLVSKSSYSVVTGPVNTSDEDEKEEETEINDCEKSGKLVDKYTESDRTESVNQRKTKELSENCESELSTPNFKSLKAFWEKRSGCASPKPTSSDIPVSVGLSSSKKSGTNSTRKMDSVSQEEILERSEINESESSPIPQPSDKSRTSSSLRDFWEKKCKGASELSETAVDENTPYIQRRLFHDCKISTILSKSRRRLVTRIGVPVIATVLTIIKVRTMK